MVKESTSAEPATVTKGAWPFETVSEVLAALPAVAAIAVPAEAAAALTLNAVEPPLNSNWPLVVLIDAVTPYEPICVLSESTRACPPRPETPPPTVAVTVELANWNVNACVPAVRNVPDRRSVAAPLITLVPPPLTELEEMPKLEESTRLALPLKSTVTAAFP